MKRISYKDLQYDRENFYFTKLQPTFDKIKKEYSGFEHKINNQEETFFSLLSNSVRIDKLEGIRSLIDNINSHMETGFEINIFLYQNPVSNAMCIPHYSLTKDNEVQKLIILVSQHFFNNLSQEEQTTILGHELAHLVFDHVKIPAKLILQEKFNLSDVKDLKSDVLRWSICCEISCDIFGYISNNKNKDVFSSAMLKYTTGLSTNIFQKLGHDTFVNLVLNQFDDISNSIYEGILTTHPLTPLRLKIIENISESELVKNYGTTQSFENIDDMKGEFTNIIDETLVDIYPELIQNNEIKGRDIVLDMALAVALADGSITEDEVKCIGQIIEKEDLLQERYLLIRERLSENSHKEIVDEIIDESVKSVKSKGLRKADIVNIARQLIIVAASDSVISKEELLTIYQFCKEFDISKQEIVLLTKHLGF